MRASNKYIAIHGHLVVIVQEGIHRYRHSAAGAGAASGPGRWPLPCPKSRGPPPTANRDGKPD